MTNAETEGPMDEREFDEFYVASFRRLTSQVYAMIGDLDEAQECVQEAFVRAWAHRRSTRPGPSCSPSPSPSPAPNTVG